MRGKPAVTHTNMKAHPHTDTHTHIGRLGLSVRQGSMEAEKRKNWGVYERDASKTSLKQTHTHTPAVQ